MPARSLCGIRFNGLARAGIFFLAFTPGFQSRETGTASQNGTEQNESTETGFRVRVAVEEVRLDAVVVDHKGRQITDLKAEEFQIQQDGQPQTITFCSYVDDRQAEPETRPALSTDPRAAPLFSTPLLTPDKARRTIAFVVDDLSMSFVHLNSARTALEKFVKNDMQPGDVVAILRTSHGIGALQLFSSDKRQLLAIIKNIRWSFIRGSLSQFMALSYCIRALQDMPGRKYLILMSSQTAMNGSLPPDPRQSAPYSADYNAFNLLADAALRAGVVIHSLNASGLEAPFLSPPFYSVDASSLEKSGREIALSKKTGGILVKDSNFALNKSVTEEIRGYYLLSYTPPANTFASEKKGVYHRVKIRVTRPGCEVHTRDGFFGQTQPIDALAKFRNSLREAIFSPFRYNNLRVNLAFGYIENSPRGYLLRSWLHVDARDLNPIEEKDGSHSIMLNTVCATSGVDNFVQDLGNLQFTFRIKKENVAWVQEHGLRFSLSLPVKNPGAYYARVAVEDPASGKIGSAYQFIEIPDLKKHRLSLSSIFAINRDEDFAWIQEGKPPKPETLLQPNMYRDPRRTPAFRSYLPGESFEYVALIYNATARENRLPDLEYQYVLLRNGSELYTSEPKAVDLDGISNFKSIPIRQRVLLDHSVQPGDYALLLQVKDRRAKEPHNIATQALDFEVLAR